MSQPTPTGSVTYHVYLLPIPDGKELPSLALKNISEPLGDEEHAVLAPTGANGRGFLKGQGAKREGPHSQANCEKGKP